MENVGRILMKENLGARKGGGPREAHSLLVFMRLCPKA
jgi:hypothetical protein